MVVLVVLVVLVVSVVLVPLELKEDKLINNLVNSNNRPLVNNNNRTLDKFLI